MRRFDVEGHARFLTFSCYRRLPLLDKDDIKRLFLDRLSKVRIEQSVRLLGWVLMPEHAHLIVFPEAEPDLRRFTHAVKRPVAEAVLRRWKELRAPILQKLAQGDGYRFWQTGGGYDRNLADRGDVLEKIEYAHQNPVRRALVKVATDYPWSSARWYAGLPDAHLPCAELPWCPVPQVALLRDLCLPAAEEHRSRSTATRGTRPP